MTEEPAIKHTGLMYQADMILAYLDERKNQTRRTKNLQAVNEDPDAWDLIFTPQKPGTRFVSFGHKTDRANIKHIKMPYGGITKEDKTRVWLIGGREFDSKADYFQYLVDKALMAKAEVKSTVSDEEPVSVYPTDIKTEGSTDGFTGVDLREHSPTGD
jgi:hypothetical protein